MTPSHALSYENFDLLIKGSAGQYHAHVLSSPAGEGDADFSSPFSELELENFYLRIGRTRHGTRYLGSPEEQYVRDFGARLFDTIFRDDIYACFRSALDQVTAQEKGLRIRLRVEAPDLSNLPWEYLYNSRVNSFLSQANDTPIVRYLDLPQPPKALAVQPPVHILAVTASPQHYPKLDVEREWQNLSEALAEMEQQKLVLLERLPQGTMEALQKRLQGADVHVLHFIGHGRFDNVSKDGRLVFEGGKHADGQLVSGSFLATVLHNHHSLRLVVLNACEGARTSLDDPFSGIAQRIVQQGIPAVVAMQFEITDQAAIAFAREFYGALVNGSPLDAAMVDARLAIRGLDNDIEWGTPVYFSRAPDGRIFKFDDGHLFVSAQQALAAGQYADAIERLEKLLGKAPDYPGADALLQQARGKQAAVKGQTKASMRRRLLWLFPLVIFGFLILALCAGGLGYLVGGRVIATPSIEMAVSSTVPAQLPVIVHSTATATNTLRPTNTLTQSPKNTPTRTFTLTANPDYPPANAQVGDTWTSPKDGMLMAYIPAGTFWMGAVRGDSKAHDDEKPGHEVALDGYWIDTTEVTNAMFARFVEQTGYLTEAEKQGSGYAYNPDTRSWKDTKGADWLHPHGTDSNIIGLEQHPVVQISWDDAIAYCAWRDARLPTEAEWEKAARGTDMRIYPWGNGAPDGEYANFADRNLAVDWAENTSDDGFQFTAPVGSYLAGASPYGIFDMAGNVWEWVQDWYGETYYNSSPNANPAGPAAGTFHVVRGGSWNAAGPSLRLSFRRRLVSAPRIDYFGFRCARSP